jgi:hypothetical protein
LCRAPFRLRSAALRLVLFLEFFSMLKFSATSLLLEIISGLKLTRFCGEGSELNNESRRKYVFVGCNLVWVMLGKLAN